MRNYSQNTQELAADVINGVKVETSALSNLTYMDMSDHAIFNVYGRIKLIALYAEVVSAASAHNTTLAFKYEQASPFAIAADLCVTSVANINAAAQGMRVVCLGADITAAALRDAGGGITSYTYPLVIGTGNTAAGVQAVGTIIIDAAGAANLTGTTKYVLHYVPLSDSAYVTAVA
jgi:hypothetical protein